jgi:phenolic acid decarboxylase
MDLIAALKFVKQGEAISRIAWENTGVQVGIHIGALSIKMEDGIFHPWIITEADLYAYDWERCVEDTVIDVTSAGSPVRVLAGVQRAN